MATRVREKQGRITQAEVDALIPKYRQGSYHDFYYFVREVLSYGMQNGGNDIYSRIHRPFCEAVTQNPFGENEVLILAPRGSLKSTVITEGYPLWRFIKLLEKARKEPDKQHHLNGLIVSHSLHKAKDCLRNIKGHFSRNQIFRLCFGDWVPKNLHDSKSEESWSKDEIRITQGNITFSLDLGSVSTALEGKHYDFIIPDDIHDSDNSATRTQIQLVKNYIGEIVPLGKHGVGTDFIFIGTRWAEHDAYAYLIDKWGLSLEEGNLLVFRAYNEDGSLWFPEFLTEKKMQKERRRMSIYQFSAQYMNNPIPPEDQFFRPEWIHTIDKMPNYDDDKQSNIYNAFMTVDPGGPYAGRDMTAIVVAQVAPDDKIYIVEAMAGNWEDSMEASDNNEPGIIERIFALANRYHVKVVGIEEVALAHRLKRDIEFKLRAGDGRFRLVPVKYTFHGRRRSKAERIMGLQPEMEAGRLIFGTWCQAWLRLQEELEKFRVDREMAHDDLLDDTAYLLDIIYAPQTVHKEKKPWDHLKDDPKTLPDYELWKSLMEPTAVPREHVWD